MYVNDHKIYNVRLQKTVAKAYMYLLPLRMIAPLLFLKGYVNVCANYFDLVLHLLGLFLIVIRTRGTIRTDRSSGGRLFHYFAFLIIGLNLISLAMALILHGSLGTLGGEDTFSAIATMLIYYFQYAFMVYYNKEIFKLFTKEEIYQILRRLGILLLIFAYLQLAAFLLGGIFTTVYDSLNVLGTFQKSSYFQSLGRLPLTGTEPAAAGGVIAVLVYPVLLASILNKTKTRQNILLVLLWLPIVYFTKSSTCYMLIFIEIIAFLILLYKNSSMKLAYLLVAVLVLIGGSATALKFQGLNFTNSEDNMFYYLLFDKVGDKNNESTVTRTIPIYINFSVFVHYPISGVGNGNQGFFYDDYYPSWGDISKGTYDKVQGVADGGVAIPSLFSGYGLLGVIAVFVYFVKAHKLMRQNKEELGVFYYIYILSGIALFINGFQEDYLGNYYAWFMLSIPYMVNCIKSEKQEGENGNANPNQYRRSYIKSAAGT